MYNIKKLIHNLIEVSRVLIGINLLKVWNLQVPFWVPILKAMGITEKSNMTMTID